MILVMDAGSVAEYGRPADLLANKDGALSALVDATGESSAAELRSRAIKATATMS